MDTGVQILLLLVALALVGAVKGKDIIKEYRAFRAWREMGADVEHSSVAAPAAAIVPALAVDTRTLPGAGTALLNPPSDLRTSLRYIASRTDKRYTFPLGWHLALDGQAHCVSASLVGDVNHILLTGYTDSGKDSWAATALLGMAQTMTPAQLQLGIVDGKGGLSWLGWENKAHVWAMAKRPEQIKAAMDQLTAERQRRTDVLEQTGCEKWEEYERGDMPLLVVFVSELMLLQAATSKTILADWLNVELTSARAMGIRYIVSTQTATNLDTRWRSQIGLYVAGYQPRDDADEPNTTFSTKSLIKFGARPTGEVVGVPPSALPVPPAGAGVFTCIQGRTVLTVRASYLNKEHRTWLLGQLPNKPAQAAQRPASAVRDTSDNPLLAALVAGLPLPIAPEESMTPHSGAIAHYSGLNAPVAPHSAMEIVSVKTETSPLPVAVDIVPAEEQLRILAAAQNAPSRRKVAEQLYGVNGGEKYTWVKTVCNAAGLLPV